jgi:hypothetical protein
MWKEKGKGKAREEEHILHPHTLRRTPPKRNKMFFKPLRRNGIQPAARIKRIRIREEIRVTMHQISTHPHHRVFRNCIPIKRCGRSINSPW